MNEDDTRIIDMTLDGEFVTPSGPGKPPIGARVMLWTIIAIVLAVSLSIIALTLWFVAMILPVLLVMGAAGYLLMRYQVWRSGQGVRWRGPGGWRR